MKVSLVQVPAGNFKSMQNAAYHSHPHPPPGGSRDDSRTVKQPKYTLDQMTASRKTHCPAKTKHRENQFKQVYRLDLIILSISSTATVSMQGSEPGRG